jgi:protein-tyrosine phosphatase
MYVGDAKDAELMSHEFDIVVNCTGHVPCYNPKFTTVQIRVEDNGRPEQFQKLYNVIKDLTLFRYIDNKKVLVHCAMGRQRSCAFATCFIMWKFNLSKFRAIDFLKSKRPVAFFGSINFMPVIDAFEALLTTVDR